MKIQEKDKRKKRLTRPILKIMSQLIFAGFTYKDRNP